MGRPPAMTIREMQERRRKWTESPVADEILGPATDGTYLPKEVVGGKNIRTREGDTARVELEQGIASSKGKARNVIRKIADAERNNLVKEILARKHPLGLSILERMDIRYQAEKGKPHRELAREYSTSVKVIRDVLELRENLTKEREESLSRQFFGISKALVDLLEVLDPAKMKGASFGQQMMGVGILSDKAMAIRKGLDGEPPKRLEVREESFYEIVGQRESILEAIRERLEMLRPILQSVPAEVVDERDEDEKKSLPLPQLDLFEGVKDGK